MDNLFILNKLPLDLYMIVANYNPILIFYYNNLDKINWNLLLKSNFNLTFDNGTIKLDLIKIYIKQCNILKKSIFTGGDHSIIKRDNGVLVGSGLNDSGQLGLGHYKNKFIFTPITKSPTNILEIVCGRNHTIIRLMDNTLMSCGSNNAGQLGLGDFENRNVFTVIKGLPANIVQVKCGSEYSVLLLSNGKMMLSGKDIFKRPIKKNIFVPVKDLDNVKKITCGHSHIIIKFNDDSVLSRGFCYELKGDQPKNKISIIKAGRDFTFFKLIDGTLLSCGNNINGQLGHDNNNFYLERVKNVPSNIRDIHCGKDHVILSLTNGTLMSCGGNSYGQLGLAHCNNMRKFNVVKFKGNIEEISTFGSHTIIKLTNGAVMGCGDNKYGQLGSDGFIKKTIFSFINFN